MNWTVVWKTCNTAKQSNFAYRETNK